LFRCDQCGAEFARRGRALRCSDPCRRAATAKADAARYAADPGYYKAKAARSAAQPHNRKRKSERQNAKRHGLSAPVLERQPLDADALKRAAADILKGYGYD